MLVFGPIWNAKVSHYAYDSENDGPNPEKPPPRRELCRDTGEEDAGEETNGGEGTVETKYKVLSWSWSVLSHISF